MKTINLIPQARLAARRERKRRVLWGVILGGYGSALLAGILIARAELTINPRARALKLQQIDAKANAAKKELGSLQSLIAEQTRELEAAAISSKHPDWSILLTALAQARRDDVVLESIDLTLDKPGQNTTQPTISNVAVPLSTDAATKPAGKSKAPPPAPPLEHYQLQLTGMTRSPGVVFEFARRLEQLGVFDRVRIKGTQSQTAAVGPAHSQTGSTTRFQLETSLSERPVLAGVPTDGGTP